MRIRVKVNPSAKTESVRLLEPGFYQVRTRMPPEDGKANARVVELVAAELGHPVAAVRIVSGSHAQMKVLEIDSG